jgi:hypothetical protein
MITTLDASRRFDFTISMVIRNVLSMRLVFAATLKLKIEEKQGISAIACLPGSAEIIIRFFAT